MFTSLFAKECSQTFKSIIYWIIIVVMGIFFLTQVKSFDFQNKPEPGQESYGMGYSDDKNVIIRCTLERLGSEYSAAVYSTYPVGFYKQVKLNEKEQKRIGEIIRKTTEQQESPSKLSYTEFEKWMEEVDEILGGGSSYAKGSLMTNAKVSLTYEQAMREYENLVEKDKFTGAYARLFCDYMGIILSLLPAFLAVTRGLRDRRSGMQDIIFSRKASAAIIIFSRYVSIVFMIFIPVLLLSCVSLAECMSFASGQGIVCDPFAFLKYAFGWLLPSVMISSAVGMVLTELTDTAVGILVQVIWWFVSLFKGLGLLSKGVYGWLLVPRHNTWREYGNFQEGFSQLALNRSLYAVMAILLVCISVWIFSTKRRGKMNIYGKVFGNRQRKCKV